MILTDTHTHLYLEAFEDDREEVMQRAKEQQVKKMILPNIDTTSIEALHSLCDQYPSNCFPMMGLHPSSVEANYKNELETIYKKFSERKYYAVGEIGIDLYWDKTYEEQQKEAFRTQIRWAIEKKLPIVIHARNSFDEIFEILDEENHEDLQGVFHCFTGSAEQAAKALGYGGFWLGLGGVLTFKNSRLADVIKDIAMENLLLETDAPYLAPVPYRGKRNESAYVRQVAEKLAITKDLSVEEVARITTENAEKLFKIPVEWS
ncbi:MAG: TatD family hydrolase [Bacteroidales bacterium]|nr:TatD family hydrolase [Bacteroidales bacterium]